LYDDNQYLIYITRRNFASSGNVAQNPLTQLIPFHSIHFSR